MIDNDIQKLRTFETKLLYLKDVYSNLYPKEQIMTSCIQHKLGRNYEVYMEEIRRSLINLDDKNPVSILKQLK